MDNFKRLKYSSLISLIGDELTNMAVLTIIYAITRSAELVASLFIVRTIAIFASGLIVPAMAGWIKNRKNFLVTLDLTRAIAILLLVSFQRIESIYLVMFASCNAPQRLI